MSEPTELPSTSVRARNRAYSVSELGRLLKGHIESSFSQISVRGEVSGFKQTERGHVYFSLKDEHSVLDVVCWHGVVRSLRHKIEDGLELIAQGTLTSYAARSRYQLRLASVELSGEGALLSLLASRRRKLTEEGLFLPSRKRALPLLPRRIAVFTSFSGAVWQDIQHRIRARCAVSLLLFPISVQGRDAEGSILAAFSRLSDGLLSGEYADIDTLIVARGGGSVEDLWVFNEESVVRAAAACRVAIISAIGHESDWTLLDEVADVRAPTPSAAAEMAVPERTALVRRLADLGNRLEMRIGLRLQEFSERLSSASRSLPRALQTSVARRCVIVEDFGRRLHYAINDRLQKLQHRLSRQRLSERWLFDNLARLRERLALVDKARHRALSSIFAERSARLEKLSHLLSSLSYRAVLARGYALVRAGGVVVRSATTLRDGREFSVLFADSSTLQARATSAGDGNASKLPQKSLRL